MSFIRQERFEETLKIVEQGLAAGEAANTVWQHELHLAKYLALQTPGQIPEPPGERSREMILYRRFGSWLDKDAL